MGVSYGFVTVAQNSKNPNELLLYLLLAKKLTNFKYSYREESLLKSLCQVGGF